MYGYTITHTDIEEHFNNAPDALDALFDYLHDQLVGAGEPRRIDWTFHDPNGPLLTGTCTTGPRDTLLEHDLETLHHSIASDIALQSYEATRLSAPDATITP